MTSSTASRRRLGLMAAGLVIVAMTGFAMATRGKSATAAPVVTAPASAPASRVSPPAKTAPVAAATTAPSPAPATVRPVQTWSTANQAAWLDNPRRGAAFELLSENIVKTSFGVSHPLLVVRCAAKRIEAFVVTGSPMKIDPRVEGKTVTVSLDGEPFRTEHWTDSDDRTAVFAPNAEVFTARLRGARTLDFGYSPHNSSDAVAQFHVAGIDALIGAASKHCGPASR